MSCLSRRPFFLYSLEGAYSLLAMWHAVYSKQRYNLRKYLPTLSGTEAKGRHWRKEHWCLTEKKTTRERHKATVMDAQEQKNQQKHNASNGTGHIQTQHEYAQ